MFSYSVRSPKRIGTSLVFIIFPHFESRMIHFEQNGMRKIIQDNHNPCGEGGSAPIRNCPLHSLNHDQVLFSEFLLAYRQDIIPIHFHSPNPPSSFIISVWYHSIISIAIRTQPAIVWRPSRSGQPPSTVATARFPLLATPMAKATRCWQTTTPANVHYRTSPIVSLP